MAVKSILDIDVNDAAFQRFLQLFEEYQAKVKELPQEWQKVDEAIDGAGGSFKHSIAGTEAIVAAIAASTGIIAEEMHKANKGQEQFEKTTKRSHSAMTALGHAAKGVSKTIFGIGRTLLKFGAIGGALGGIAGGIGMDDLANVALSRQRTARGVGMTAGQHAAFSTYYGQFGNADAVANNIADARNDVTKRWIFNGLGIGQSALKKDNNFQLSMLAERDAQRVVKSAPRGEWMNIAKAMGLTQVFSDQTLRVMRHTSSARMDAARAGAIRNAGALGFSNKTAADWSQFSIALHKAGIEIETGLIVALHRLTPELTKIVNGVSDWINAFAKSPQMGKWIADAETGIKSFAKYLTSPQFKSDLASVEKSLRQAAVELAAIVSFLYPYAKFASAKSKPVSALNNVNKAVGSAGTYIHNAIVNSAVGALGWAHPENNPGDIRQGFGWHHYKTTADGIRAMGSLLGRYPKEHNADTLASIIPVWNGHGKNDALYVNEVSRWAGVAPGQPINMSSKRTMSRIIAAMSRVEGTDRVTVSQAAAALGAHSESNLPQSVDRLISTIRKQVRARPASVVITNNSNSRVSIQTQGAGH